MSTRRHFAIYIGAADHLGQGARLSSRFLDDAAAITWARAKANGESILLVNEDTGDRWWIEPRGDGFVRVEATGRERRA